MRREWIEIKKHRHGTTSTMSPSMRREWIEIQFCRKIVKYYQSPSMRREWIEIQHQLVNYNENAVSLHAEGVD